MTIFELITNIDKTNAANLLYVLYNQGRFDHANGVDISDIFTEEFMDEESSKLFEQLGDRD